MSSPLNLQIAGLLTLFPLAVLAITAKLQRNLQFWLFLAAAIAGASGIFAQTISNGWEAGLSANLWASCAVSLIAFAALSLVNTEAYKLAALLLPYLLLLALLALLFASFSEPTPVIASAGWFRAHVVLAVASYAVLTLGAISGLAVLLQERVLKKRQSASWAEVALPPLLVAEELQIKLLLWAAIFMAAALASGFANTFMETGAWPALTHKVLLSILAFVVLVILLVAHRVTGLRGRRAARWVLAGYLLLTLGYPGVKFVKDVLIG
ncbi:cytochrome c biogenesis protein CcsA [Dongia sp.]|uniref:cytochrome c biogenesis protein CcsA n=1 Tax=Dongia sp. TaxID=1977262 RepID=UPI0035B318BA